MPIKYTRYLQKMNVCVGILNYVMIGPFFIEGNLDTAKYEITWRESIATWTRRVVNDNFTEIEYQQDLAVPYYSINVRAYLENQFICRWIGKIRVI